MPTKNGLTREINKVIAHLQHLNNSKNKGNKLYLGDPINPQIKIYEKELAELKKEREQLNKK